MQDDPLYQKIDNEFQPTDPPMTVRDAVDRWGYSGGHTRRVMDWMSDQQKPPVLEKLPGVSPIQWKRR